MKKAYKTQIELTSHQAEKVNQTIGVCRYVYNLYLKRNQELYEKEKKFIGGLDFSKWLNNIYTKENDPGLRKCPVKR